MLAQHESKQGNKTNQKLSVDSTYAVVVYSQLDVALSKQFRMSSAFQGLPSCNATNKTRRRCCSDSSSALPVHSRPLFVPPPPSRRGGGVKPKRQCNQSPLAQAAAVERVKGSHLKFVYHVILHSPGARGLSEVGGGGLNWP